MITILFFIFVALTIFHFIYDGIIAPSLRFETRMELFAMRDELRLLKIDNNESFSDELFDDLQGGVNKQIKFLHEFNLSNMFSAFKAVMENPKLNDRFIEHEELLENCKLPEISILQDRISTTFIKAFLINSGGWSVYIIPPVVLAVFCGFAWKKVKRLALRILETTDSEMQSYFRKDGLYN